MKIKSLLPWILSLSTALIAACGGGESEGGIRLVNATNDYAALDLYEDDNLVVGNVAAGTGSGYVSIEKDDYNFKVRRTSTGSTLLSTDQSIGNDDHRTLLTYVINKQLKAQYLEEDEDEPDEDRDTKLRVFNASSEAGQLDVFLTDDTALEEGQQPDITTTVETLTSFSEFRARSYRLRVTAHDDPTDVRLDVPGLTFGSKQVSTLVLTTSSSGTLVNGLLLVQDGPIVSLSNPTARVRLVASAANKGSVAATANGVVLSGGTASPQVGGYSLVPAGDLTLDIKINGTAASVPAPTASLKAGADYTLLVRGTGAAGDVTLISDDNTLPTSSTANTKIRLVNGTNGLTGGISLSVDFSSAGSGVLPGAASTPYYSIAGGDRNLEVTSPSASKALYTQDDVALQPSSVYTVFILGEVTGTADNPVVTHIVSRDR